MACILTSSINVLAIMAFLMEQRQHPVGNKLLYPVVTVFWWNVTSNTSCAQSVASDQQTDNRT